MKTMPQSESLVKDMLQLMESSRDGFGQGRVYVRAVLLALAEVLSFGSHHVTDLLRSVGLVAEDWTAWYRLLQQPSRMQEERLGETLVALHAFDCYPGEVARTDRWTARNCSLNFVGLCSSWAKLMSEKADCRESAFHHPVKGFFRYGVH